MAESKPDTSGTSVVNTQEFAEAIGKAVAEGIAANTPKKMTFGQYTARRNRGRATLTRDCYQNGFKMERDNLSNADIDLLNRITHSGRYVDRRVEVIVRNEGSDEVVELRYPNKTADQRFELRGYIRSLTDMLEQIVAAQTEERQTAKAAEEAAKPRRHFGEGQASREAREHAGA